MTIYKLKEVLDSQYNRSDVKRHHYICWRNVVIRRYGPTKMNKMKAKTLQRQAEISKTCRAISHMSIDKQITDFTELLTCLGNANTVIAPGLNVIL